MLNQMKLDQCEGTHHDFQPVIDHDGSVSIYVCLICGGRVSAIDGLRYVLIGSFEEEENE